MTLTRIMYTIARAIIEKPVRVIKTHNNNELGVMITYSGEGLISPERQRYYAMGGTPEADPFKDEKVSRK